MHESASLFKRCAGHALTDHLAETLALPLLSDHSRESLDPLGFYPRWGEGEKERLAIQRYRCLITGRTFSLLLDSLLPYHYATTSHMLQALWALFVQGIPRSTLAREESLSRGTLWHWRRAFLEAIPNLRLPDHAAPLEPAQFLRALRTMPLRTLAFLFAGWKELEPKHSAVGIYAQ